jgi:hypothetical protein
MAVSVLGWSHDEFWKSTPRCLLSQIGIKTGKRTDGVESAPVASASDLQDILSWSRG